jgi:hypothetical protein
VKAKKRFLLCRNPIVSTKDQATGEAENFPGKTGRSIGKKAIFLDMMIEMLHENSEANARSKRGEN